jgi:hypothetical protein
MHEILARQHHRLVRGELAARASQRGGPEVAGDDAPRVTDLGHHRRGPCRQVGPRSIAATPRAAGRPDRLSGLALEDADSDHQLALLLVDSALQQAIQLFPPGELPCLPGAGAGVGGFERPQPGHQIIALQGHEDLIDQHPADG